MKVLVDSSVWIEYLRSQSQVHNLTDIDLLLEEGRIATCWPIRAEVLSGYLSSKKRAEALASFDAMDKVDPDWNEPSVWESVVKLAYQAYNRKMSLPGIVDRMILVAALHSDAVLWSLDKNLNRMANEVNVTVYNS